MKRMNGEIPVKKWAKALGISARSVRRGQAAGAPFGPVVNAKSTAAVLAWYGSVPRTVPAGVRALLEGGPGRDNAALADSPTPHKRKPDPAPDGPPGDEGAPHTARRAEGLELAAYQRLIAAIASGDLVRVAHERKNWQGYASEVRRFNESIPAERRLGEQVPVQQAQDVLRSVAWALRTAMRSSILHGAQRMLPGEMQVPVANTVGDCIDSFLLCLADSLHSFGLHTSEGNPGPIPPWAVSALQSQLRNQFPTVEIGVYDEAYREVMKHFTTEQAKSMATRRAEQGH